MELKVLSERVQATAKKFPVSEAALKELFPEAFELDLKVGEIVSIGEGPDLYLYLGTSDEARRYANRQFSKSYGECSALDGPHFYLTLGGKLYKPGTGVFTLNLKNVRKVDVQRT